MDLPSPDRLKAAVVAFLSDSKRKAEREAALGLADCETEMRPVRNDEGKATEVQVVFRCRTRKTFEKYKEQEHELGPWRERDAFFHVKWAVAAVLGKEWKLGHFDFVPGCRGKAPTQKAAKVARPKPKRGGSAPKPGTPSLHEHHQEEEASRLFALVKKLDGEGGKPPSVLTVFRLYCVENLSTEKVCQRCKCGKGTVLDRLKKLRQVTGMDPRALRVMSTQFERIERELSDSRARRINRKRALDQPEDDDPIQD